MKGEFTLRILEFFLEEFGPDADFLLASSLVGKVAGRSFRVKEAERQIRHAREKLLNKIKDKTRLVKIISKLRRQGLVTKDNRVTEKGFKIFEKLKLRFSNLLPKIGSPLELEKDHLKIVIFDIPEKWRAKRLWLRQWLVALGFEKLQKSVWIGETKLPADFITQLKSLDLLLYVKIFSVFKKGMLDDA